MPDTPPTSAATLAEHLSDDVKAAIRELIDADLAMHPVYGNTSACSGGIGGASITSHCAELCPSPKHDAARERHEKALRRLARWLDGVPLDAD